MEDAVLEVPVEAVVDVPGEEGGVPELPVALGAGEPLYPLLYMYYFSMDLDFEDAVLEVPVEAVVDVPGEEGGVPELPVALGAGEPLPSLLPSSLLLSPSTYSNRINGVANFI